MCRPPAMLADRPAASDGGPVSRTRALHVCLLTGAPRRWRPGRCPSFLTPIPPTTRRLIVQQRPTGGCGDSPAHRPGADGRCASLVAIPPYPPPGRFGRAIAGYVDHLHAAMGSRHRPGMAPGQDSDSPPLRAPRRRSNSITRVKVRTRAKLRVSIDCDSHPRNAISPRINIPSLVCFCLCFSQVLKFTVHISVVHIFRPVAADGVAWCVCVCGSGDAAFCLIITLATCCFTFEILQ